MIKRSFLILLKGVLALQANLQAQPFTTHSDSKLLLMLSTTQTIPVGGGLKIQTPTSFLTSASCTLIDPTQISVTQCTPLPNTVDVKFGNPITGSFQLQISGYQTPMSTVSTGLTILAYDGQGFTIDSVSGVQLNQLTPSPANAALTSDSGGRLGPVNLLTLTVTPSVTCATCTILITGPYLGQASCPTCTPVSSGLQFSRSFVFGVTFTVLIAGFKNPSSFTEISLYQISAIQTSNGGIVDQTQVQIQATQPSLITGAIATVVGDTEVSHLTTLQLDFQVQIPMSPACVIYLQVPSDFTDLKTSLQQVSVSGIFSTTITSRNLSFFVQSGNLIQINDACLMQTVVGAATIKFGLIRNPAIVSDTKSFKLVIQDKNGLAIAECIEPLFVNANQFTAGSIQNFDIKFQNPVVQSETSAAISILPTNRLTKDSYITIDFPAVITLAPTCKVTCLLTSNCNQFNLCSVSGSQMVLKSLFLNFGYNPATDKALKLNITDFYLPSTVKTILNFTVTTYFSQSTKVEQGTFSLNGLIVGGKIDRIDSAFNLQVTRSYPAFISATFNLTHSFQATPNTINVTIPSDIGLSTSNIYCTGVRGFSVCQVIQNIPNLDGSKTLVLGGLNVNAAGSTIQFRIGDIRMPRYQGQVKSLILISTTSKNELVDSGFDTINVNEVSPITNVALKSGSQVNSANTWLLFTFNPPIGLQLVDSDQLVVILSSQIQVKTPTCYLSNIVQNCTYSNNTIRIQNFAQYQFTSFVLNVTSIRNPTSTLTATGNKVLLVDSFNRTIAQYKNDLNYTTSVAAALQVVLLQDTTDESQLGGFKFTFGLTTTDSYVLTIPNDTNCMLLNATTFKVTDQNGLNMQSGIYGSNIVVTTKVPINQFQIGPIRNPNSNCSDFSLTISTYSDTLLQNMKSQAQLLSSIGCLSNCAGCMPTQKSFCTACFAGQNLNNGACIEQCPAGTFFSIGQCLKCSTGCKTCSDSNDFCTSCQDTGQVADTDTGTCMTLAICEADPTSYVENLQCKTCLLPCLECTSGGCNQCRSDFYLINGTCSDTCPADFDLKNGNVCYFQTVLEIIILIFIQNPCQYGLVILGIFLSFLKCCLKQRMSLIMTLLTLANLLQTGILTAVCYYNFMNYFAAQSIINMVLLVAPAFAILIQLVQNIWVCIVHKYCLGHMGAKTTFLIYIPGFLFTFHMLSMVNVYRKQQTDEVENAFFQCYLRNYKLASQLSFGCILLVGGILTYQSIMIDQSKLCLDAALVMLWTGFYLQAALSYPPEDHIVWLYILKEIYDGDQDRVEDFGKSFELHTVTPTPIRKLKKKNWDQDSEIHSPNIPISPRRTKAAKAILEQDEGSLYNFDFMDNVNQSIVQNRKLRESTVGQSAVDESKIAHDEDVIDLNKHSTKNVFESRTIQLARFGRSVDGLKVRTSLKF